MGKEKERGVRQGNCCGTKQASSMSISVKHRSRARARSLSLSVVVVVLFLVFVRGAIHTDRGRNRTKVGFNAVLGAGAFLCDVNAVLKGHVSSSS